MIWRLMALAELLVSLPLAVQEVPRVTTAGGGRHALIMDGVP